MSPSPSPKTRLAWSILAGEWGSEFQQMLEQIVRDINAGWTFSGRQ